MPSMLHESLVMLLHNQPRLAPELLTTVLGVPLPAHSDVQVASASLAELVPTEYHADLVLLLVEGQPVMAIVVEVQLSKKPRKRFTWPMYLMGLRARYECDACLFVLCADDDVARWCAQPILCGPGSVVQPHVIGPQGVPVVTDTNQAGAAPELAVLSSMAHGNGSVHTAVEIATAAMIAVSKLDDDHTVLYSDLILASLSEAARKALETMLPKGYELQSEFARKHFAEGKAEGIAEGKAEGIAEGKAEGIAEGVLVVLEARKVPVSEQERQQILECTDPELLRRWLRKVAIVQSVAELFDA